MLGEERSVIDNGHQPPRPLVFSFPDRIDISPHAPAMASRVSPFVDVRVAPRTERILDDAILVKERIPHALVSNAGVGGRPVVAGWSWNARRLAWVALGLVLSRWSAIPEFWPPAIFVVPFGGDVAVVILEIWSLFGQQLSIRNRATSLIRECSGCDEQSMPHFANVAASMSS